MAIGDVYVCYRAETEQWVVREEGSNVSMLHPSKWEALRAGCVRARGCGNGADLFVPAWDPVHEPPEQVRDGPVAA
jgi:hypothetical protein